MNHKKGRHLLNWWLNDEEYKEVMRIIKLEEITLKDVQLLVNILHHTYKKGLLEKR